MWAKLTNCPSHMESLWKVIPLFSFFKTKWKIPQVHSRFCLRLRNSSRGKGTGERKVRRFIWKDRGQKKFLWGELRGAVFLFLACEAAVWCVIACSFLQSGARTFRVSTPDSDIMAWTSFTLSVSVSWAEVKRAQFQATQTVWLWIVVHYSSNMLTQYILLPCPWHTSTRFYI